MKLTLLSLSLVAAIVVEAAPAVLPGEAKCTTKAQRKAWHKLTKNEKLAYINAEKCLMSKPAKLGLAGARTMFDEFQKLHVLNTEQVHGVGAFLPFHRYLVHTHETILRTECNYTGTQPYWDEVLDAGNFTHSVVLDPETGFGGDGYGANNCIKDGPFKDYVNSIGPFTQIGDHCIDRKIDECSSASAGQQYLDACMAMTNFSTFWPCLEAAPHAAGHGGIGGQMTNLYSSPGDPIFYLHHTYLDKVWWQWQTKDLSTRLTEVTGTNVGTSFFGGNGTFPGFPGNGSFPGFPGGAPGNGSCSPFPGFTPPHTESSTTSLQKRDGDPGNVTTLNHVLTVYGMLPNVTIKDVMNVQGGLLCYEYL